MCRGFGWMFGGQTARLVLQAVYFVALARALGAEAFGLLAAVVAVTAFLAPLAGWGSGNLLIRAGAQGASRQPRLLAAALTVVPILGVFWSIATATGMSVVLPAASFGVVFALAVSELVAARVVELCAQAFQGLERLRATSTALVAAASARAAAALAFTATGGTSVREWSLWLVVSSFSVAVAVCVFCVNSLSAVRPSRSDFVMIRREGRTFAVGLSASSALTDADKIVVARLSSLEAAGIYTAAYRVVSLSLTPIVALFQTTYARFFREGREGVASAIPFAMKMLIPASIYGAAVGVALFFGAPAIPWAIGESFSASTEAVRWLALLPLLQAVTYVGGDCLTGGGHQALRTRIQVLAAILSVGLAVVLVPQFSWRGAAAATLITYGLLAAALWTAVLRSTASRHALPVRA